MESTTTSFSKTTSNKVSFKSTVSGGLRREEILRELKIIKSTSAQKGSVLNELERVCQAFGHKLPESAQHVKDALTKAYVDAINPSLTLEEKLRRFELNWKYVAKLCKALPVTSADTLFDLKYHSYIVRTHVFMEFRSFKSALKYCRKAKQLCEKSLKYMEKLSMYQQLGYIYRLMSENEEAVKQFKKMLQLAWQEGNLEMELKAYDNLSMEYFYLGQLQKSNYYHDRFMRGKSENDFSIVKKVTCNLLRSRRENKHSSKDMSYTAG